MLMQTCVNSCWRTLQNFKEKCLKAFQAQWRSESWCETKKTSQHIIGVQRFQGTCRRKDFYVRRHSKHILKVFFTNSQHSDEATKADRRSFWEKKIPRTKGQCWMEVIPMVLRLSRSSGNRIFSQHSLNFSIA